ncbi:MAG: T9SS type A sorting domain-containing protein, partial [Dolichospermum sp.]
QWGTYYGGSGADEMGYCVLNNNSIYLSGRTTSASQSVLTTSCSYQSAYGGGFSDACLSKFNFSGFRIWSTLYGGSGTEDTPGISCNLLNDEVYLTGSTTSNNSSIISSPGAQQISYGGGAGDGFIAKFDGCPSVMPPNTTNPQNMQVCFNSSAILSTSIGCGIYWYSTPTGGSPLFSGSVYTTSPITNNTTYFIEEITCGSNTRTAVHLTVVTLPIITAISSNSVLCAGQSTTLTLSGANSYSINGIATNSISILNPTVSNVFTISGSNSNGCINSNTLALLVNPCTSIYKSVNNEAISIYPNPFFDIISLKIPSAEQENIEFIVVNELGKIVISQKIYKSNTSINCVYLSKGVYIAYILKNKHPIEIIKILK